jgi:tetratricopeptide (TPR) repeat protein
MCSLSWKRNNAVRKSSLFGVGTLAAMLSTGCVTQPGARASLWPTKQSADATSIGSAAKPAESLGTKVSGTARGVKGQFASVGTAVTSAYGKAKTAVSSAFTSPPTDGSTTNDATTLANTPKSSAGLGPEVNVIQGQMYESQGNYAKAMDFYSKALEAEPKNTAALTSMARLHDRQNNGAKAIEFYEKAIEGTPNQAALYSQVGDVRARMGQIAVAKNQYQKAINLDPKNRGYRSSMAGILIDEGQAEQAEQELRQVDGPAMAQYQMAYLYMSKQNYAAAKQHLGNALAIEPNLKPARDMMSSLGGINVVQQASGLVQQTNGMAQQASGLAQQATQIYQQTSQMLAQPVAWSNAAPPQATTSTTNASAAATGTPNQFR